MPPGDDLFVAGLVLAAGTSSRLGRPKQLLPYGEATLLDHTVATARTCRFDQLLVAVGGAGDEVREHVDLSGAEVVVNDAYGDGCSSSIAAAIDVVAEEADVLVLLLGDQPGMTCDTVAALIAGRDGAALSVCRYEDGLGHPFAFSRELFGTLRELRGDKAVWKLVSSLGEAVARVPVAGPVPIDVDTWADYAAVRSGR
ncbi:MAG: molybdenum cofactor cytidylyltransferase [Solirubrobacteraceae bacterium]|jgi:molybdenum cofactor cytidylyltransferase|nr:molybdenum cofactor cytidylyltransferase [Solirubrobacteraceae bacterium]